MSHQVYISIYCDALLDYDPRNDWTMCGQTIAYRRLNQGGLTAAEAHRRATSNGWWTSDDRKRALCPEHADNVNRAKRRATDERIRR